MSNDRGGRWTVYTRRSQCTRWYTWFNSFSGRTVPAMRHLRVDPALTHDGSIAHTPQVVRQSSSFLY
eukprot:1162032-Pelagomonas_calceolata.AAC.4